MSTENENVNLDLQNVNLELQNASHQSGNVIEVMAAPDFRTYDMYLLELNVSFLIFNHRVKVLAGRIH